VEGTNKAHENGEAMGLVGVRLTAQLAISYLPLELRRFISQGFGMRMPLAGGNDIECKSFLYCPSARNMMRMRSWFN
jgi:hypothetical protein